MNPKGKPLIKLGNTSFTAYYFLPSLPHLKPSFVCLHICLKILSSSPATFPMIYFILGLYVLHTFALLLCLYQPCLTAAGLTTLVCCRLCFFAKAAGSNQAGRFLTLDSRVMFSLVDRSNWQEPFVKKSL